MVRPPIDPSTLAAAAREGRPAEQVFLDLLAATDPSDPAAVLRGLVDAGVWDFTACPRLSEIPEPQAQSLLTRWFAFDLAYDVRVKSDNTSRWLTQEVTRLIGPPRRWWTNVDPDSAAGEGGAWSWDPATRRTFDVGVVALSASDALVAWFTGED